MDLDTFGATLTANVPGQGHCPPPYSTKLPAFDNLSASAA